MVYSGELFHLIVYIKNPTRFPVMETDLLATGVMLVSLANFTFLGCLVFVVYFGGMLLSACQGRLLDVEQAQLPAPGHYGGSYKPPTTLRDFYHYFKKLLPFIWPSGRQNLGLQLMILVRDYSANVRLRLL